MKTLRDKLIFDPPPLGTVLYMPGLPGAGSLIYDRSPYGNHGTISGAIWKFNGRVWYLDYDGSDDQTSITDAASLDFTIASNFSYAAWINPDVLTASCLLNKLNATDGYIFAVDASGILRFYQSDSLNRSSVTAAVVAGSWQRVVYTYTAADKYVRFYVNGSLFYTNTTAVNDLTASTANAVISGTFGGFSRYDGGIALDTLISSAVSPLWVANDYQQTRHLFGVW